MQKKPKNIHREESVNKQPRILVIVPAYNEERSIAGTIKEIRNSVPEVDILVVDDGSKDKTAVIARELNAIVVSHPFNLRIGGAVQTGFKFAMREGYDIAIQVDADGQHMPSFIPKLIQPIVEDETDISIGSRYMKNEGVNSSLTRYLGVKFFSWLTTKITKKRITDCSSGFRALNRRAVHFFADEYPIDFPDAEALILASRFGLRIREVPVKFRTRNLGESSLNLWRLLYYPIKETFSIAVLLTKRQEKAD